MLEGKKKKKESFFNLVLIKLELGSYQIEEINTTITVD
jgi:hypothetical protein